MNEEQVKRIIEYLQMETNYAVIINGKYGVGKTYFYKNFLVPEIKKTNLPKNAKKQFKPLHVSLFGIKNIEEVQTKILLELHPILKEKNLKLAMSITKSLMRGILQFTRLGDIDKYIQDINESKSTSDWLKYDELVICFDDLDRKSESLSLPELFGFINSLVENEGAKILIILNDEKWHNEESYKTIKEKVVGVSIEFEPNVQEVYQKIIEDKYNKSGLSLLYKYLKENALSIIKIIQKTDNNFRNLIFFLEHFKVIYAELEKKIGEDNKKEKLEAVLNFTLAIAIEYKIGAINSNNCQEVKNIIKKVFNQPRMFGQNIQKEENYARDLIDKYYADNKQTYSFDSIFDYVTSKKSFCINTLKSELEQYFVAENGIIPEHKQILNELSYLDCLDLSDSKYKELTEKMLEFVDCGKYQLKEYPGIFHYATRFNNLLEYNINDLKERFKKGIEKGIGNYTYMHNLDFEIYIDSYIEFRNEIIEIKDYCLETNNYLQKQDKKSEIKELFSLLKNDFDVFYERVNQSKFMFTPFWLELEIKEVAEVILNLSNSQIWRMGQYFKSRNYNEKELKLEKKFIIELIEIINNSTPNRHVKNLKNVSLDYLTKVLSECESSISA
jgi:hypothetical protein